jgi:[ribosomal protein S5]-alanine N-acetyltransferase
MLAYMYTEIKTKRLLIRPWRFGDEKELAKVANNSKIARNLVDTFKHPYTLKDAKAWIKLGQNKDRKKRIFAIVKNEKILGNIGFSLKDKDKKYTAVIGCWLGEEYWGNGYATEALKAVTKYAFKYFKIERMEAKAYTWNPASTNVMKKAGYTCEGLSRKCTLKDGRVVDEWIYSIIKDDMKKQK